MIFCWWLAMFFVANLVRHLLVGHDPRFDWRNLPVTERLIILLWSTIPLSWFYEQTDPSPASFTAGFALLASGAALTIWAKMSNPWFCPTVQTPGQVVRTGPYQYVKHPGYIGMLMQSLGTVLILNHSWGYLPLSLYAGVLVWRARKENRIQATFDEGS